MCCLKFMKILVFSVVLGIYLNIIIFFCCYFKEKKNVLFESFFVLKLVFFIFFRFLCINIFIEIKLDI